MRSRSPAVSLRMVLLEVQGYSPGQIAQMTGYNPADVAKILAAPDAARIRKEIENRTIDTVSQIRSDLQALVPTLLHEQVELALNGKSDAVRHNAGKYLMELAGHSPIKQVALHKADPIVEDYKDKTEDEIRKDLLKQLEETPESEEGSKLLH